MPFLPLVLLLVMSQQAPVDCADVRACRQLAIEAAEQQDHERFHDLAWRAMQKAGRNDPDLMYLLARAQALSGRPGDALVMLSRLADMRVPTDAATNEDFRRVRALRGWPELQQRVDALAAAPVPPPPDPARREAARPTEAGAAPRREAAATPPEGAKVEVTRKTDVAPAAAATPPSPAGSPVAEMLRFSQAGLMPSGLAYDAVSRRFLVADQRGRRLAVVDEFSKQVATMAGAQAGFGEVEAVEIDPRDGTLWVVSDGTESATLHKLQLISGRVLSAYALPREFAPARLVDVAVSEAGVALVLDGEKGRVFRLADAQPALVIAAALGSAGASSIAPAQLGVAYVAHPTGIVRVDLRTRAMAPVRIAAGVDASGIARLRWTRGSLIAIQRTGERYRAVRLVLDGSGHQVSGAEVLDPGFATGNPTAATVAGGSLYYLVDGDGGDVAIKKIVLRGR